nr:hypothetical protein [Planctomycetota bacterium]
MKSARRRLVQDIRALERRLRRDWSKEAPPLSEELRVYRQSWLSTLSGPTRAASALELNLALETGDPLLVGDYHALRRARSGLRNLVKELPRDRLPGLLLELLPHDITVRAKDAIQRTDLRLVDGRPVAEAYGPSLRL